MKAIALLAQFQLDRHIVSNDQTSLVRSVSHVMDHLSVLSVISKVISQGQIRHRIGQMHIHRDTLNLSNLAYLTKNRLLRFGTLS